MAKEVKETMLAVMNYCTVQVDIYRISERWLLENKFKSIDDMQDEDWKEVLVKLGHPKPDAYCYYMLGNDLEATYHNLV